MNTGKVLAPTSSLLPLTLSCFPIFFFFFNTYSYISNKYTHNIHTLSMVSMYVAYAETQYHQYYLLSLYTLQFFILSLSCFEFIFRLCIFFFLSHFICFSVLCFLCAFFVHYYEIAKVKQKWRQKEQLDNLLCSFL